MHGFMDKDTGTGIVKKMVRKFEVLGGQESGFSLTPRKEYNFTSASHLAEQQSVESPSKRLRLTKPGTSEPPATPASSRASPAWGPVSGRGRSRPSRSTGSPSCRPRRPRWPVQVVLSRQFCQTGVLRGAGGLRRRGLWVVHSLPHQCQQVGGRAHKLICGSITIQRWAARHAGVH